MKQSIFEKLSTQISQALILTKKRFPEVKIDQSVIINKFTTDEKEMEKFAEELFNIGFQINLSKESENLKSIFNVLSIQVLGLIKANENTQFLKLVIYCDYVVNQLELLNLDTPALYISLKALLDLELNAQESLTNEFELICRIIFMIILYFQKSVTSNKKLIHFITKYSQKLIKNHYKYTDLSPKTSLAQSLQFFTNFLIIIKFYFQNNLNNDGEESIASIYIIWEKYIKDRHIESTLRYQLTKIIDQIYQIKQMDVNFNNINLLNEIQTYYIYYQSQPQPKEKDLESKNLDLKVQEKKSISHNLDLFRSLKNEILQSEKQATKLLSHTKNNDIILGTNKFSKLNRFKIEFSIAMDKLSDMSFQDEININLHAGNIYSYFIEIVCELINHYSNEEEMFSTQIKLLNLSLKVCELMDKDSPHLFIYKSHIYTYKIVSYLKRFNDEETPKLYQLVKLLVSLNFSRYEDLYIYTASIFTICSMYIGKYYDLSMSINNIFSFFHPLTIKLDDSFNRLLKCELDDSERIEVYLSIVEKFNHLANFYFKQYIIHNKEMIALLTNGQALIKRVLVMACKPLGKMQLTADHRLRILTSIFAVCNQHIHFLREKLLFSMLKKADIFIDTNDLKNASLVEIIFSIKNLQKSIEEKCIDDPIIRSKTPIFELINSAVPGNEIVIRQNDQYLTISVEKKRPILIEPVNSKPPVNQPRDIITTEINESKKKPIENDHEVKDEKSKHNPKKIKKRLKRKKAKLKNKTPAYKTCLERDVEDLKQNNIVAKNTIKGLKNQIIASNKNIQRKVVKIQKLNSKVSENQLIVESIRSDSKKQEQELEEYKKIINELRQSAQEISENFQQQIKELENKLNSQALENQNSLKKLNSQMTSIQTELKDQQQKLTESEAIINSLRMQLEQQPQEYKQNFSLLIASMGLEREAAILKAAQLNGGWKPGLNYSAGSNNSKSPTDDVKPRLPNLEFQNFG